MRVAGIPQGDRLMEAELGERQLTNKMTFHENYLTDAKASLDKTKVRVFEVVKWRKALESSHHKLGRDIFALLDNIQQVFHPRQIWSFEFKAKMNDLEQDIIT